MAYTINPEGLNRLSGLIVCIVRLQVAPADFHHRGIGAKLR